MIRSTDARRPVDFTPEQEEFIKDLEKRLEERKKPVFVGWPVERWLTAVTLVVVLLSGVVATVVRWHDVDILQAQVTKLESRVDTLPAANDVVRKDIYDERMRSMNEKLDALIIDVKSIKMTQGGK